MFGLMDIGIYAALSAERAIAERRAFDNMCKTLPEDEEERRQEIDRRRKHREALEIANAGRAKNFWGD